MQQLPGKGENIGRNRGKDYSFGDSAEYLLGFLCDALYVCGQRLGLV